MKVIFPLVYLKRSVTLFLFSFFSFLVILTELLIDKHWFDDVTLLYCSCPFFSSMELYLPACGWHWSDSCPRSFQSTCLLKICREMSISIVEKLKRTTRRGQQGGNIYMIKIFLWIFQDKTHKFHSKYKKWCKKWNLIWNWHFNFEENQ